MDTRNVILVVCDPNIDHYEELNFQLLGKARALSQDNGSEVLCIYWGGDRVYAKELIYYGANSVILCDCNAEDYTILTKAVKQILEEYLPNLVLFTGTSMGKAVAATVATLVGGGLVADCIEIQSKENQKYIFFRAALSSQIIAKIVCTEDSIQMCTVKPNVFNQYVKRNEMVQENLLEYPCDLKSDYDDGLQVVELLENAYEEPCSLEKSKLIFSVGRGVNDEDFEAIKKLANLYGAELGGTRIMVEKGKIPKTRQIGQSGTNVAPELYIAFGISGANQHIAGIQNAKNVIAINNDEKAAIFSYSDYAIVSDVHDVVTNFMDKVDGGSE